jgi:hypothetical protein
VAVTEVDYSLNLRGTSTRIADRCVDRCTHATRARRFYNRRDQCTIICSVARINEVDPVTQKIAPLQRAFSEMKQTVP